MAIQYWNRHNQRLETETVYGDAFVKALYGNSLGFKITDSLLVRRSISKLYGGLQSTRGSAKKIPAFVKRFDIPMKDYEGGPFQSFNDFFIRRFRPNLRPFPETPGFMGAPAEARYLAFESADEPLTLPVKGMRLDPMTMLGSTEDKERFRGGPCLLARLCPVDYHRFHFPDSGKTIHFHEESGRLHSVNPLALKAKPDLFFTNERHVSILRTDNFGIIAYVEVGALFVGKIVQTHPLERNFRRGEEKGYFLFGGSTVIVYGEKGKWMPSSDLLENSAKGLETLVRLGDTLAEKI